MKPLQDLLGTRWPLIQAPMAGVQGAALAAAVSNAGGLGSLPAALLSPSSLVTELQALRAATSAAFNVNFFCHEPPAPNPAREAAWRHQLAPYARALGLDPEARPPVAERRPFDAATAELIAPFEPPILSFHFGLPEPALLQRVRRWGARIMASATTVAEARWLQDHGADIVIAQGLEAGGHRGHFLNPDLSLQMGTLALLPQILRAVQVPVVAAGGLASAAGIKAALQLGAAGVQLGTVYLLCPEASTSAVHRAALQSEGARHTALTPLFTGRPARGIVNRLMREQGDFGNRVPAFPGAAAALAPLRAAAESQGLGDFSPLWAGQNVQGCAALPAADLTRQLAQAWGEASAV